MSITLKPVRQIPDIKRTSKYEKAILDLLRSGANKVLVESSLSQTTLCAGLRNAIAKSNAPIKVIRRGNDTYMHFEEHKIKDRTVKIFGLTFDFS